jgi:glycosyltransferase involved in cell wall biosynthesis
MERKLILYQRRSRAEANFSIEGIFQTLLPLIRLSLDAELRIAPFFSTGIFSRIRIMIDAMKHPESVFHLTGDILFAGLLRRRSTVILAIHDCGFMSRSNSLKRWILEIFLLRLPVRRAAAVICGSEFTKKEIIHYLGRDPGNIFLIPDPVVLPLRYAPSAFNHEYPTILQVGTSPNKNLIRLAQALKGIACKLVILGVVDHEAKETLIENKIDHEAFAGVTPARVVELYEQCDIVAFCSTYEGFGLPIIEAQTSGRPVVTSKNMPMAEVAGDGAELVDPFDVQSIRDGILRVINDSEYRSQLVSAGLKNCKRFEAAHIANQYLEVYRLVMENRV